MLNNDSQFYNYRLTKVASSYLQKESALPGWMSKPLSFVNNLGETLGFNSFRDGVVKGIGNLPSDLMKGLDLIVPGDHLSRAADKIKFGDMAVNGYRQLQTNMLGEAPKSFIKNQKVVNAINGITGFLGEFGGSTIATLPLAGSGAAAKLAGAAGKAGSYMAKGGQLVSKGGQLLSKGSKFVPQAFNAIKPAATKFAGNVAGKAVSMAGKASGMAGGLAGKAGNISGKVGAFANRVGNTATRFAGNAGNVAAKATNIAGNAANSVVGRTGAFAGQVTNMTGKGVTHAGRFMQNAGNFVTKHADKASWFNPYHGKTSYATIGINAAMNNFMPKAPTGPQFHSMGQYGY